MNDLSDNAVVFVQYWSDRPMDEIQYLSDIGDIQNDERTVYITAGDLKRGGGVKAAHLRSVCYLIGRQKAPLD